MKQRMQGLVMGVILTVLMLSATMAYANNRVTREITYGINVMLNGEVIQFDYDSRPFVMGGRTFLPLRTIAELVGLPVDFDSPTNTAIVGSSHAEPARRSLNAAAPVFDRGVVTEGSVTQWNTNPSSQSLASVNMGGGVYSDVMVYRSGWDFNFNNRTRTVFTLHNLNGQYRWLAGYVGRVDGSGHADATMNIIGDGTLLQSIELEATALPVPISVFVEGIRHLQVEFVFQRGDGNGSNQVSYAFNGFVE